MEYRDIITSALKSGVTSENAMYAGLEHLDDLLEMVKDTDPRAYWKFMRKSHEDLFGPHYDENFAKYDVSQICYTDNQGEHQEGEHWTLPQITSVTTNKTFPEGTTEWDKYVAYNSMYADLCRKFNESEILEATFLFYFDDEDAHEGKVWRYMCTMNKK